MLEQTYAGGNWHAIVGSASAFGFSFATAGVTACELSLGTIERAVVWLAPCRVLVQAFGLCVPTSAYCIEV